MRAKTGLKGESDTECDQLWRWRQSNLGQRSVGYCHPVKDNMRQRQNLRKRKVWQANLRFGDSIAAVISRAAGSRLLLVRMQGAICRHVLRHGWSSHARAHHDDEHSAQNNGRCKSAHGAKCVHLHSMIRAKPGKVTGLHAHHCEEGASGGGVTTGCGAGAAGAGCRITMSTRRFCVRPSSVALEATG